MPQWEKTILARWLSRAGRAALALLLTAAFLKGEAGKAANPAGTGKRTRHATPARRTVKKAAAQPSGDLALLKAGITEQNQKQPAAAVRDLKAVRGRLPKLADYIAYSLAAADFDLGNFDAAVADLAPLWKNSPPSPLVGGAALIAARAHKQGGNPAQGIEVLREHYPQAPQPAGDALLAECYRATGDLASAAVYYQRVYYQYPLSPEAGAAASALTELRTTLGELYPPPTTQAMFERAGSLTRGGDYRRARQEYEAILPAVGGVDRDVVRVRLGELYYFSSQADTAYSALSSLDVSSPEADAERLCYMLESARRLDQYDRMADALQRLERYPSSPWRLKALVSAANRHLVENRPSAYLPLYRACYESFTGPQADYCHWKVVWYSYIHRQADAAELLREHLVKYPSSDHTGAALYFLGRLAETADDRAAAKAFYSEVGKRTPNAYYADLAEERLGQPGMDRAAEAPIVRKFLDSVAWPAQRFERDFDPTPATQARLERARLLAAADLEDLAEEELRFGAQTENQPHVLAVRLAQVADKYSPPHRSLQLIKSLVPGYLSISIENAPASFWRLLYPLPWRRELERNAKLRGLDPYIVAGLIRQESEFNPKAVSPAQAYGLTQILPSTGRMLLRVSRRRFRAGVLFLPDVNLRLGTTYLRRMYDAHSERWELTLAAYNAGATRVASWLSWADYREPAEFIETIPFSETRNYVFAVLRNASMYRKLYSREAQGPLASDRPAPAARAKASTGAKERPAAGKKAVKKRTPARRTVRHRKKR
jgi:soluble lytic murein transglycosylase